MKGESRWPLNNPLMNEKEMELLNEILNVYIKYIKYQYLKKVI
jgi:hypothetical protein